MGASGNVKRYELRKYRDHLTEAEGGDWVGYEDHAADRAALVAQLEAAKAARHPDTVRMAAAAVLLEDAKAHVPSVEWDRTCGALLADFYADESTTAVPTHAALVAQLAELTRERDAARAQLEMLEPDPNAVALRLEATEAENRLLESEVTRLTQERDEAWRRSTERYSEVCKVNVQLAEATVEGTRAREGRAVWEERCRMASERCEVFEAELEQAQAAAKASHAELEAQAAELTRERDEARNEYKQAATAYKQVCAELNDTESEVTRLTEALDNEHRRAEHHQGAAEALRAKCTELTEALAAAELETARTAKQSADNFAARQAAEARVRELEAEVNGLREQCRRDRESAEARVEALETLLAASEAREALRG